MNKGGARWGKGGASSPCHTWGRNRYVVSTCPTLCQPRVPSWNCPTLAAPPSRLGNESRKPTRFYKHEPGRARRMQTQWQPRPPSRRPTARRATPASTSQRSAPNMPSYTAWYGPTLARADTFRHVAMVGRLYSARIRGVASTARTGPNNPESDASSECNPNNSRENRPDAAKCCQKRCREAHPGVFRRSPENATRPAHNRILTARKRVRKSPFLSSRVTNLTFHYGELIDEHHHKETRPIRIG